VSSRAGDGSAHDPLDTAVVVETPEHIRFRYRLAGPVRRGAAYLIDLFLRLLVLFVFAIPAMLATASTPSDLSGFALGFVLVLAFILEWVYFVGFETLNHGQSPGKRLLGLRVVSNTGRPLGFVDSVLRNLLRAADYLPVFYALGFIVVAGDSRFRRLGDFVGGTLVVAEDRAGVDPPLTAFTAPTAAELAAIPAALELRPRDVEAIELFLRRRASYSAARAEELAAIAAAALLGDRAARFGSASRLLEVLYSRAVARA
jgi:uncharacterized RDD family membrane protein YckC